MSSVGQGALKSLKDRGQALFQNMKFSDCSFRVGPPDNQKVFKAHKLILSMASPVFETMFYGQLAEKEYPIEISDVEPESFEILMEYLYTDRINVGTFEEATNVCYVAHKYMLTPVVNHCVMCVKANLSARNVCRAYEFANLFEQSELNDCCMKMIQTKMRSVLSDPGFVKIHTSTLLDIFHVHNSEIDSELDLFNALERYANANSPRPDDCTDCGVYREPVKNIRFFSNTTKQFAEGPGSSIQKIFFSMNIASDVDKDHPMPEGFRGLFKRLQRISISSGNTIRSTSRGYIPYSTNTKDGIIITNLNDKNWEKL